MAKYVLSEVEILRLIEDYYTTILDGLIEAERSMRLSEDHSRIILNFFMRRYTGYGDIDEYRLTENDLTNVFNYYLKDTNQEVDNFKYIGYIRRAGYYTDEDTPIFEGVEINTREREKKLIRINKDML